MCLLNTEMFPSYWHIDVNLTCNMILPLPRVHIDSTNASHDLYFVDWTILAGKFVMAILRNPGSNKNVIPRSRALCAPYFSNV